LPYATYRQQLSAVTCLSTTACIAMGSTDTNGVNAPLAEAWTGTTWQVAPVPMPTVTATWAGFTDGYCSNQGCVAVGNYYQSNSNDPHPFADHWVPGGWTARPLPLPVGAASGTASAITCRSITLCTALVSIATGSVILAWNGSTWSIDATPTSTGATGQWLSGVSCLSSTSCVAVGSIGRYVSVPWVVRKG
jgi:hypothetical protein